MRRGAPVVLVALGLALLLGSYLAYSRRVVIELRREAQRTSLMFAKVYGALGAQSEDEQTAALFDLARQIREMGVPVVVTDESGRPAAAANLPFEASLDDPRVLGFIEWLDRQNPPVLEPGIGTVHYGNTPLVRGLRIIPILLSIAVGGLLAAGVYALLVRGRAERERVWAGMARESAHQLATPLSSLTGWLELMADQQPDGLGATAVQHMRGDLDRLERVAHRFERIGRPPRRDPVEAGELLERVASYFRARVPTLAHTVSVEVQRPDEAVRVAGDPVLLEWALEVLVKNAIDALAGRGGRVQLSLEQLPEDEGVRIRVQDDGPGVPRELRARIFDAGFTTKQQGWGIGLSLARRIVEENHGGRLRLGSADRGATFEIILR